MGMAGGQAEPSPQVLRVRKRILFFFNGQKQQGTEHRCCRRLAGCECNKLKAKGKDGITGQL